jgi:four helix bundle protein
VQESRLPRAGVRVASLLAAARVTEESGLHDVALALRADGPLSVPRGYRLLVAQLDAAGLDLSRARKAVSVPANVAEGQGRRSSQEFLYHVSMAHGSLREVETHLMISRRLGYSDEATCEALMHQNAEVGRLLNGLMRRLRAPSPARPGP